MNSHPGVSLDLTDSGHTCSISRNVAVGNNGRRHLQALASGVKCLALPMNAQTAIQNGFELGRAYDFYFDITSDVKVGDQLTVKGKTYNVSAVQVYDVPRVGHIHAFASQEVSS